MGIVERIRDQRKMRASEEASARALAQAEAERKAEEEQRLRQENLRKTKQILEKSGVTACLVETRDKLTRSGLLGLRKGKLRYLQDRPFLPFLPRLAQSQSHLEGRIIGGVELSWDREETSVEGALKPRVEWKVMRIFVSEEGDLLLEKRGIIERGVFSPGRAEISFQVIEQENWGTDRELVEKAVADYYFNPLKEIQEPLKHVGPPSAPSVRVIS